MNVWYWSEARGRSDLGYALDISRYSFNLYY